MTPRMQPISARPAALHASGKDHPMAKGQKRSNRETKKPKQDKKKKAEGQLSQVSESFKGAGVKKPPVFGKK